jgi:Zn-finger nucleic acid-binding protein
MKCPSCQSDSLTPSFIDGLFRSHHCQQCQGNWLLIEDYVSWVERNKSELKQEDAAYELEDSKAALLCPVTGAIMQKYRINNDAEHKLDYSPQVGGVWLDAGEWEYLKAQNIACSLNKIFTRQWQKQLRDNDTKATFAQLYKDKFGEADYEKVKELRRWLNEHENKAELRSYLLAEDPYSA